MLVEAENKHPRSVGVKLNLALARRTLADYPGALRALDAALAIEPYLFLALLSNGSAESSISSGFIHIFDVV